MDGELCWKGDSEAEEGNITGTSIDGGIITERAAASPGAAQKSMEIHVGVEEEEVIRWIQTRNSTTNTWIMDTAKSKRSKIHLFVHLISLQINKKFNFLIL